VIPAFAVHGVYLPLLKPLGESANAPTSRGEQTEDFFGGGDTLSNDGRGENEAFVILLAGELVLDVFDKTR